MRLGTGALERIRRNPTFPYKTGNLKWNATRPEFNTMGFSIIFDTTIAPYIPFLENGVRPHTYFKQGYGVVFSKGSTKHVGFISQRATNDVIQYLADTFKVNVAYVVINNQGKQYGTLDALAKK